MTHASYCKLVPPRASFAQDTSPDEVKRMTDQDPASRALDPRFLISLLRP